MKLRKIKKKFPIRNGIGKGEISQISKVITYYKKKKKILVIMEFLKTNIAISL